MKDFKLIIALASVLLIGYLVAEYNKPKATNWASTLYYNDKIPYGTYIFYHQLSHLFPGASVVKTNQSLSSQLQDTSNKPGSYIIVSHTLTISKPDVDALLHFIKAGNNVFISTFSWGGALGDTLKLDTRDDSRKTDVCHFTNPNLLPSQHYTLNHTTGSLYFSSFDTAHAESLSQNGQGQSTYLRYTYGKGHLYVFANPHLLSNYSMLSCDGADYVAKAISYLPEVNTLYWDEYQNHDIAEDESPMRVIFSHDSLRWAYFISLWSLLVFVLFEAKRRQRIIPIAEPLKNTTTEFVSMVGQVYYEQRDNKNIAVKKITYLADYLRSRYLLKPELNNREFAPLMAQKTGMNETFIEDLIAHIRYVNVQQKITDHELITLNQLIEKFYAQA